MAATIFGSRRGVDRAQRRVLADLLERREGARRASCRRRRRARGRRSRTSMPQSAQEQLADGAGRDPRRRLARRGALEDVAQVARAELHPAREVRVPRARARQALRGRGLRVDRHRAHHVVPVGVVAVEDPDRDRGAERHAAAHAALEEGRVLLDLHPPAAAVAVLAARELAGDEVRIDAQARGDPLQDRRQARSVRFAGGREAQGHGESLSHSEPVRPVPEADPSRRSRTTRGPGIAAQSRQQPLQRVRRGERGVGLFRRRGRLARALEGEAREEEEERGGRGGQPEPVAATAAPPRARTSFRTAATNRSSAGAGVSSRVDSPSTPPRCARRRGRTGRRRGGPRRCGRARHSLRLMVSPPGSGRGSCGARGACARGRR